MIVAGIDAGSRTIKVVVVDAGSGRVVASGIRDQGLDQAKLARGLFASVLARGRLKRKDVSRVVATGYGREAVDVADTTVTEITCQARGVSRLVRNAATIVDIGGQDSKLIRLDPSGVVRDFAMNDRCAAGTGRFLEVVAARLKVDLAALDKLASASRAPARINSTCVVFAESEIIGLLAGGAAARDIAAGVEASLTTRLASLARQALDEPVVFTGGVALLPGMAAALGRALSCRVKALAEPQFSCALGAALIAGVASRS